MNDGSQHAAPPMWLWVPAECDEPSWSATIAQRVIGTGPVGETRASEGYSERPLRPMLEAVTAVGGTSRGAWAARPWRARGLRLLVYGLPVAGSLGFVRLATVATGVPTARWGCSCLVVRVSIAARVVVGALYVDPAAAAAGRAARACACLPGRGAVTLPARARRARWRASRSGAGCGAATSSTPGSRRDPPAACRSTRHSRPHHARSRRAGARLRGEPRTAARSLVRRSRPAQLVGSAARHREAQGRGEILNKPGRPTDEEWAKLGAIRSTAKSSSRLCVVGSATGSMRSATTTRTGTAPATHAAAGGAIPLAGRIVAIADVYDVITSVRSYKEAATPAEARAELARCSGASSTRGSSGRS